MTPDQIDHLTEWLSQNRTFSLTIKHLSKQTFLEIQPRDPSDDDGEVFYVPLNQRERAH